MKIAAVVVTFNRKEYLVKNIEALLAQVNAPMDILIIDNASTDGTEETIRHYMDAGQILYENTGENLGGAGGFNFGIRRAYEEMCIRDRVYTFNCHFRIKRYVAGCSAGMIERRISLWKKLVTA